MKEKIVMAYYYLSFGKKLSFDFQRFFIGLYSHESIMFAVVVPA